MGAQGWGDGKEKNTTGFMIKTGIVGGQGRKVKGREIPGEGGVSSCVGAKRGGPKTDLSGKRISGPPSTSRETRSD